MVKGAAVDLKAVGAHYAMSSLFASYSPDDKVFCYTVKQREYERADVGRQKLAVGAVSIRSEITWESMEFCFGVMHWGDHNISVRIQPRLENPLSADHIVAILQTFDRAAFPETQQLLEKTFGQPNYFLQNLFRDEQRRITEEILDATLEYTKGVYRQICYDNVPLLRFLHDANVPAPKALFSAAEYVYNFSLEEMLKKEDINIEEIRNTIEDARLVGVSLDTDTLEMAFRRRLEHLAEHLQKNPMDMVFLEQLNVLMDIFPLFPFETNLRRVQNIMFDLMKTVYPDARSTVEKKQEIQEWIGLFESLGEKLMLEIKR
jgi:hypothetical protein